MASRAIKPGTRADDTVWRLRTGITQGVLAPRTLLAEAAVARQLGVSRVPVREALFTLEREGLVEFSSTGRAYVKELSPHDFEELFQLRMSLEPLAARLAAPKLKNDARELEENIAATARAKNLRELTRLDLDFHELILKASGQTRMLRMWLSLRSEMELWLGQLHRDMESRSKHTRENTVASHAQLLMVFREQTPAAAERLSREHLVGWWDWLPGNEPSVEKRGE